jgi:hypothetical protein
MRTGRLTPHPQASSLALNDIDGPMKDLFEGAASHARFQNLINPTG